MSPWTPLVPGDGPDVRRTCAEGNDYDWGLSTSARLRSAELEIEGVREELTRQAATNEDLRATLAMRDRQLGEAQHEECAWRDLAKRATFERDEAQQERDHARAQLDDAISTFRAEKEAR